MIPEKEIIRMGEVVRKLQTELAPWQQHNFGNRPPWQPLVGISEEAGELAEKLEAEDHDHEEIRDALADMTVYLADFSNAVGDCQLDVLLKEANANHPDNMAHYERYYLLNIMKWIGKIDHAYLKQQQGIRVTEDHVGKMKVAIGETLYFIHEFSHSLGIDLAGTVEQVWASVSQRDWKKFPKNGRTE